MAKNKRTSQLLSFVVWVTGVLVSLAVGFAMIDAVIAIRWIPLIVTQIAGWIVVITTLVSAVLAIINK